MAVFSTIAYGIGYAVGFLGAAAGITMTGAALTIATGIANLGAGVVMSAIARKLSPKVSIPKTEIQAVINQADAPRRVYVGKALAGGIRAFFHTGYGTLYQLVVVNHGQINRFVEFWLDGQPVAVNGGDVTTEPFARYVDVFTRDGSGQGGDYAGLTAAFPTLWPVSRRLQNQATFLTTFLAPKSEDFMKVFPKSYNTVAQWVIEGSRVHDPRSGTTGYSDNAALVQAFYLTHPDGYRLDPAEVDWDSVVAMANVADLSIPQKAGGTAPSLRLWGYWTLDESPADVLARMHSSSGIRAYETQDGRIGLIGGSFGTPACTLTAKDIRQIVTREAISEREGYNVLIPFFMSEVQKFEITELDAWRDEERLAQEGEISVEYRMEMCPNQSQAMRLAKQQMANDNRPRVEIITNLVGLKARYPRHPGQRHTILLDYRPEDGSGREIVGEYEVIDHEFDPVELECRIELALAVRASEEWTPAEEGELITAPPATERDTPPELDAVVTQRVVDGRAQIEVRATPVAGRDDLEVQAEYQPTEWDTSIGPPWRRMTSSGYIATSDAVADRQSYRVRARWTGTFEGVDAWEDLGIISIQVDATPPGTPTELIPSLSGTAAHLTWRNPPGAFAGLRVYRNTTTNFATATMVGTTGGVPGQISEYRDTTTAPATTYRYWVVAANVSGVEGIPAGPATISIP